MKIALIVSTPYGVGGVQNVMACIANHLAKNHEVTIVHTAINKIYGTKLSYQYRPEIKFIYNHKFDILSNIHIFFKLIKKINERIVAIHSGRFLAYFYYPKKIREQFVKFVAENCFDCIIAVTGNETMLLSLVAPQLKCKCIGWQHNSYVAYFLTKDKYLWRQEPIHKCFLKNLDICVVLTKSDKKLYEQNFGCHAMCIYNPLTISSKEKSNYLNRTLVFCGRLVRQQKGLDFLVKILIKSLNHEKDWQAIIIGDGPDREWLENQLANGGIRDRIIFVGQQNDVGQFYMKASILVLTSRWEGFGLVVTEAFEYGLPVISFKTEGPSEIVQDGINGLLIDNYDIESYTKNLIDLMDNSEKRRAMSKAASKRAEDFSIDLIMQDWNRIIV